MGYSTEHAVGTYINCKDVTTPAEYSEFDAARTTNIILFSMLATLWLCNLAMLAWWMRSSVKAVTWILYSIVGLIILARLYEVIQL